MVDKYGTGQDPDCYPGTSTLINLFDIRDDKTLETAEHDITEICASELEFQPPPYNLEYLCQIHKSLFQDIYPWAGQTRQVDISKGSTRFCNVSYLKGEADRLFSNFEAHHYFQGMDRGNLVSSIAELYGSLNMIHPFREGNGRAQRIFFEHIVTNVGFEIYWEQVSQEEWINANIAAVVCNYQLLEIIFEGCIGDQLE